MASAIKDSSRYQSTNISIGSEIYRLIISYFNDHLILLLIALLGIFWARLGYWAVNEPTGLI